MKKILERTEGTIIKNKVVNKSVWKLEIDLEIIKNICKERGFIEYKKHTLRCIEDFFDDELLSLKDKPYKDFYN